MNHVQSRVTMHQQQTCRFLNLPPELRNRIYELSVVCYNQELILEKHEPPALLRICRQIRSEASSVYYASNRFEITNSERLLIPWLTSVPSEVRRHIQILRLSTSCVLSGMDAALRKDDLLTELYRKMHQRDLGDHILLQVFIEFDRKLKAVWASDPIGYEEDKLDDKLRGWSAARL